MQKIRAAAAAVLLASLGAAAAPTSADAKIIFETAAYTGVDTGEYIIQSIRYVGAAFTLDKTTEITGIGGQFGGYPGGTIFGAIVPLSSPNAVPDFTPSALEANSVADVVFAVSGPTSPILVDLTEPLDVTLSAGSYAVIFGSGLFGADGFAGFGDGNTPVGSSNFVNYSVFDGDSWTAPSLDGVRITVSAVPEVSTWAMIALGFAGLALAAGRNGMRGSRALG